jgi:hypothetical protein
MKAKICPTQFIFNLLEAIFNPSSETIKLSHNKLNFSGKVRHEQPGVFGVWVGCRTLGYRVLRNPKKWGIDLSL